MAASGAVFQHPVKGIDADPLELEKKFYYIKPIARPEA